MQSGRLVLISLIMFVAAGCASQSDLESMRRDSDEMKNRIYTIEKSLGEVRGDVKEGVEKALTADRQRVETMQREIEAYQKEMASIRKSGADLQATLDSARVDMQLLTGKVDDLRIQAQRPADDLALLKEDTGKRLALLEERLTKLELGVQQGFAELQKKAPEQPVTPEGIYQQGLDAMKAGDTVKAREFFTKFLDQNPRHKLAANAHYWIGETYYSEKNFEQAILEFQEVIKNFPEKEKVPAAMLKQGMAFKEIGDLKSASYIYKKLTEEYPKSEEAKIAKEKLRGK